MRFHAPNSNTSHYLWPHANNHPYGAPPVLEDNVMDYGELTWDDVPDKFINHDEEHKGVPVCDTCAEGRFFVDKIV